MEIATCKHLADPVVPAVALVVAVVLAIVFVTLLHMLYLSSPLCVDVLINLLLDPPTFHPWEWFLGSYFAYIEP